MLLTACINCFTEMFYSTTSFMSKWSLQGCVYIVAKTGRHWIKNRCELQLMNECYKSWVESWRTAINASSSKIHFYPTILSWCQWQTHEVWSHYKVEKGLYNSDLLIMLSYATYAALLKTLSILYSWYWDIPWCFSTIPMYMYCFQYYTFIGKKYVYKLQTINPCRIAFEFSFNEKSAYWLFY